MKYKKNVWTRGFKCTSDQIKKFEIPIYLGNLRFKPISNILLNGILFFACPYVSDPNPKNITDSREVIELHECLR